MRRLRAALRIMPDEFIIEEIEGQPAEVSPPNKSWWTPETEAKVLYLTVGAGLIFLVFRKLQVSNTAICCGDFDGYYHIRWSRLLWENFRSGHIFPPQFTWLPLTTLNPNSYVDHHLLFHILQIPFTWFGDLTAGAKASATVFATLAVLSCFWLIVRYRVRYPLVWLLALLASSAPFLYRLSMAKAPPISLIFMVAGIYLLFEEKYKWLMLLGFLYVWTYSLWPTLVAAAFFWTLALAWSEDRFEWRPLVLTSSGVVAGFIVNPYFPKNFALFWEHLATKTVGFGLAVGNEWYPYDSWELFTNSLIAMAAMVAGYVAFDWTDRKRSGKSLFFLLFATMLLVAGFRSRRFVEYWPPFAVLFAAFALQPVLVSGMSPLVKLPDDFLGELRSYFDKPSVEAESERTDWLNEVEFVLVGVALALLLYYALSQLFWSDAQVTASLVVKIAGVQILAVGGFILYAVWRKWTGVAALIPAALMLAVCLNTANMAASIADDQGRDYYRGGAEWMRDNIPAGERIFNTDWDDFPRLFFFDTKHNYVSGLDPGYLHSKDAELSKLYENITLGKEADPGPLIRDRFGARYVFSDKQEIHNDFFRQALGSGWLEKVYEDDDCAVLKIRDQKGEPADN